MISDDAKSLLRSALDQLVEAYEERDAAGLAAAMIALRDGTQHIVGNAGIEIVEFTDAYTGFLGDLSLSSQVFSLCTTLPRGEPPPGDPFDNLIAVARDLPRAVTCNDAETLARHVVHLEPLIEACAEQLGVDAERVYPALILLSGNDPGRDDWEFQELAIRHYNLLNALRPVAAQIEA